MNKRAAKAAYMKQWRLDNLQKMRERDRVHYEKNRDAMVLRAKQYRENNREKYLLGKSKRRVAKYGLTLADYDRMSVEQDGKCAICGNPETSMTAVGDRARKLAIDHCHTGGRVRALLCGLCNKGLGCFLDSPDLLRAAALYIERHRV